MDNPTIEKQVQELNRKLDLLLSFFRVGDHPARSPVNLAEEAARFVTKVQDRQRVRSLGNSNFPGTKEAKHQGLPGDQGRGRHNGAGAAAPTKSPRSLPGYRGRHDHILPAMGQAPPGPEDGQG